MRQPLVEFLQPLSDKCQANRFMKRQRLASGNGIGNGLCYQLAPDLRYESLILGPFISYLN